MTARLGRRGCKPRRQSNAALAARSFLEGKNSLSQAAERLFLEVQAGFPGIQPLVLRVENGKSTPRQNT